MHRRHTWQAPGLRAQGSHLPRPCRARGALGLGFQRVQARQLGDQSPASLLGTQRQRGPCVGRHPGWGQAGGHSEGDCGGGGAKLAALGRHLPQPPGARPSPLLPCWCDFWALMCRSGPSHPGHRSRGPSLFISKECGACRLAAAEPGSQHPPDPQASRTVLQPGSKAGISRGPRTGDPHPSRSSRPSGSPPKFRTVHSDLFTQPCVLQVRTLRHSSPALGAEAVCQDAAQPGLLLTPGQNQGYLQGHEPGWPAWQPNSKANSNDSDGVL